MATSRKIARKASKQLRTAKEFSVREVAGSDLAQVPHRKKTRKSSRKKVIRKTYRKATRRTARH
jgi:hypothetical protein